MSYSKKTLSYLKQSLADRHDSGTLPTSSTTLSYWTRLLNRGLVYCSDKLRLVKQTSLTTSSGTIALPDDFLTIARVFDGTTELAHVDQEDVPAHVAGTFWITGNHFDGFSLNTTEDKTYTVKYSFRPSEMSSDSDVCVIPDPEAVVAFAYGTLRRSETDPLEDADAAFDECDERLTEIQSALNINENFTGFTVPDLITTKYHWE